MNEEKGMKRCEWSSINDPLYQKYHDEEWGNPVHDDVKLFEFLILEGAQAGLSWKTILSKRENYRKAFMNFDPRKVAAFGEGDIKRLVSDPGIVRNRLKISSAIQNARAFLRIQQEYGSFDKYIWGFVGNAPRINRWESERDVPARSVESDAMSKALGKLGFNFVGSTICYAFMQATGMVNDHAIHCFRYSELAGNPI